MKRFVKWATDKRWAVVTALVLDAPAMVKFVVDWQEGHGGQLNWVTLLPGLAGFVIQRRVWAKATVEASQEPPS